MRVLDTEFFAEFLGMFVLILFGTCVDAQAVLGAPSFGSFLTVNLGWGIGVCLAVIVAMTASEAHLNPAVTLAVAVFRGFPWRKVPKYLVAQMSGAFVASSLTYLNYQDALKHFDGGVRRVTGAQATAGIWATYPQTFLSNFPGGFIDQSVGTLALVLVVFALTDERHPLKFKAAVPFTVGLVVAMIGLSMGFNSGYAINPARDLAPRMFTFLAGWGSEVFTAHGGWWWVPVVAPCIGALIGAGIYQSLIGSRLSRQ